jgi:hypothetical protein
MGKEYITTTNGVRQKVLHGGSSRRFSTTVPTEVRHGVLTEVRHEGSHGGSLRRFPRRFATTVPTEVVTSVPTEVRHERSHAGSPTRSPLRLPRRFLARELSGRGPGTAVENRVGTAVENCRGRTAGGEPQGENHFGEPSWEPSWEPPWRTVVGTTVENHRGNHSEEPS